MSRVEVYSIAENGDLNYCGDARNAFGGAMHIWLTYAYQLGIVPPKIAGVEHDLALGRLLTGGMEEVWKRTGELSPRDQMVMRGTFDRVLIGRSQLPAYIEALLAFANEHPTPTLDELLTVLRLVLADESKRGVGFNQTSVCANPWWVDGDDEDDEGRPYNIERDSRHWWLNDVAA